MYCMYTQLVLISTTVYTARGVFGKKETKLQQKAYNNTKNQLKKSVRQNVVHPSHKFLQ